MNQTVVDTIREYFKTKPVERAWVFGSFSRGEERPDSDVDILIQFLPDAKMGLAYFGMICDLEDLLKRPVDLVIDGDLKVSVLSIVFFVTSTSVTFDFREVCLI